ncbi:hypothetical protein QUF56_12150 [Ureibacillus composti]|nr:hypothetical protein [Ureibacillus composti]
MKKTLPLLILLAIVLVGCSLFGASNASEYAPEDIEIDDSYTAYFNREIPTNYTIV